MKVTCCKEGRGECSLCRSSKLLAVKHSRVGAVFVMKDEGFITGIFSLRCGIGTRIK